LRHAPGTGFPASLQFLLKLAIFQAPTQAQLPGR
jgi:hypothetical protein